MPARALKGRAQLNKIPSFARHGHGCQLLGRLSIPRLPVMGGSAAPERTGAERRQPHRSDVQSQPQEAVPPQLQSGVHSQPQETTQSQLARQRLQWQVRADRLSWAAGWAEDHQIECAAVRGDRREQRGCRAPRRPRRTNTSPVADVVGGPGAPQRTPVHAASCQPRQSSRCHASRKAASAQCVSYHASY